MVDLRPHLRIDREPAVELVARFREETHGEFALEHEDAGTWGRGEREEFECQGGGDLSSSRSFAPLYRVTFVPQKVSYSYLVRRVADANIKVRQVRLDHIPQHDLQSLLLRLPLHPLGDLGRHPRIEFHGDDSFCLFEDFDSQVARSGADFENDVALLEVGFVDYGLGDSRVAENVLAEVGVHFEDVVGGFRLCCCVRIGAAVGCPIIALFGSGFWHFGWCEDVSLVSIDLTYRLKPFDQPLWADFREILIDKTDANKSTQQP